MKDGVIRRLINKWLRAGIVEGERMYYPVNGTPQGGVTTPPTMLQTLCFWCERWRARLYPKDHIDFLWMNFNTFYQGAY